MTIFMKIFSLSIGPLLFQDTNDDLYRIMPQKSVQRSSYFVFVLLRLHSIDW